MDGRSLARLRRELEGFVGELLADLPRRDQRVWAAVYLRGLLLDGDRKSIQPMAERLEAIDHKTGDERADYEQALQQFVNQSTWPADAVRDRLQRWLAARVRRQEQQAGRRVRPRAGRGGGKGAMFSEMQQLLIVDETGFPKQGEHSVGVARQYSGTLGKVANCQMGVSLQYARQPPDEAAGGEVFCVDMGLYLPEAWAADRDRMEAAGVPAGVVYEPKWRMALGMLERAKSHRLEGTVLADSTYGSVTEFRNALDQQGWRWCVGIDSTLSVIDAAEDLGQVPPWSGKGRPPTRPARVAAKVAGVSVRRWASDHAKDFRKVTWREGSRGKMSSRFAAWRVRPAHRLSDGRGPQGECWLLAEWPDGEQGQDAPTKFFFSNLPADASLRRLVRTAKGRWWVELSYREMKDELGLDHFEGRGWAGWHHHMVLVMLAYAFVVAHRRQKGGDATAPASASRRPAA